MLNHFLYLSWSILTSLGSSRSILVQLGLSWSILIYHGLTQALVISRNFGQKWEISGYVRLSRAISGYFEQSHVSQATMGYLGLSKTISGFICKNLGYLWQYMAISAFFWLSLAIAGYLYRVSNIRVQVEAGDSKLLRFQTFWLFFSHPDKLKRSLHS